MGLAVDHLTVVAPDLPAGAAFVEGMLGVSPQLGGAHPGMGTHNLLLSLGASTYLEVIAIDPNAPTPSRPRWFALDSLKPGASPRLAAWVAGTPDIHAACAKSAYPLGQIEPMSRGSLSWLITIAADGSLPMGGLLPALIEWPAGVHPGTTLPASGCTLLKLEICHPQPGLLQDHVESLGLGVPVEIGFTASGLPQLLAHIQTPHGVRVLFG